MANYWDQVVKINKWQKDRIYKKIVEKLFGNLSDKRIAILGFAFKANTNDTRESPAIEISKDLLNEGAKLVFYDPKVSKNQIIKDLSKTIEMITQKNKDEFLFFADNVYDAVKNVDAIVLITEWKEFKNLDWVKISNLMIPPSWVFDTRDVVDPSRISGSSVNLWKLGNADFN